jgi:hypothetical protein
LSIRTRFVRRGPGRLFDWLDDRHGDGPSGQVVREATATGALSTGRRTFEPAGRRGGDHHDGVPIQDRGVLHLRYRVR